MKNAVQKDPRYAVAKKKMKLLEEQLANHEKEKGLLLDLSDVIIKVREKDDLIKVFASTLKGLFYFTHAVISLIDQKNKTYYPFLLDIEALPIRHRKELPSLLAKQYFLDDPFIEMVSVSETPVSFTLEDIIDKPGVPGFVKVNYETGIKEAMIARLNNKMETIGFVFIYSDRESSFSDTFKNILYAIAPLLSNAVANISINDEIKNEEFITQTLLALSNEMVTVRKRSDLLNVINHDLKRVIHFTHSVMLSLDEGGKTYHAFLTDPGSKIKDFPEYEMLINRPNPVNDGIYDVASQSEKPIVFDIRSFDLDRVPTWVKLNHATGAKEILIKMLPDKGNRKHSLILFSDKPDNFKESSFQIVERISSQLATAVNNILANEEISNKDKDKSFLLEFSHEIASATTKTDISQAIHTSLKKLSEIKAYFIRIINDDGTTMSPFVHDKDVFYLKDPAFKQLLDTKIPVNAGITGRAMSKNTPVFIDFDEEIRHGNTDPYIEFWKNLGAEKPAFQKMFGTSLSVGDKKLGILWVITPQINKLLLEGICAQVSVAISNIRSNEEVTKREQEKLFLLNFSTDIAAVRTKDDLDIAISKVFENVLHLRLTMIRLIEEDGVHLKPYIHDKTASIINEDIYEKLFTAEVTIREELTERVLLSNDPVVFNIEEEEKQGNKGPYIYLWKKAGFKNAYGAPLRVGNTVLGTLWLLTDHVNINLLKGICAQISIAVSNIKANEKVLALKRMLEHENDHLKEQIKTIYNSSDIVGNGPEIQKVYSMMSLVAPTDSTVLLLGETGTGKELIARAIHNYSPRRDKLLIKVNCAALPYNLIESELFGHEKGAFTGAIERRLGKFELANNSTLFLDEIGEMPLETQVKLLRVLQEHELERVGGKTTIKVNVRIIAATNRNLEDEVKAGRFRSDLYYRLNVFPIHLPPLRDRIEDIEPLAEFFLVKYNKNTGRKVTAISSNVLKKLKSYSWPGNVRELEHLIERSILLTQENTLKEIQLPISISNDNEGSLDVSNKSLQEVERSFIIETLRKCNGKIAGIGGAAEILDIPSTTLHSKLLKLEISKADYFGKKD
ncbi:MAG TPA: sigma 54-interacting transcriptional regulator [Chitinophagaceae bacterium]|nr:sigma 54-interacting transcriptional regulator [Chitinophagaceae bacterium]